MDGPAATFRPRVSVSMRSPLGGLLGGEASGETFMRTSLQRWIVGCTAAFGTMMFVAGAAILTPAKPDSSARIASGCPSKVEHAVTHGLDDA
jgi:hypothetical protein